MTEAPKGGAAEARLELLAACARPVQHEINNLLTVIQGNLNLLDRAAAKGEAPPPRQLDRIRDASARFERSSRALLALLRRPVPEPASVAPVEALRALAPLLELLLPGPGALVLRLEAAPVKVALDRAAFDAAMVNLARAVAALPRGASLALAVENGAAEVALVVAAPALPDARGLLAGVGRVEDEAAGLRITWPAE